MRWVIYSLFAATVAFGLAAIWHDYRGAYLGETSALWKGTFLFGLLALSCRMFSRD